MGAYLAAAAAGAGVAWADRRRSEELALGVLHQEGYSTEAALAALATTPEQLLDWRGSRNGAAPPRCAVVGGASC